jgi:uncharacterized membrane protein YdbT with pleckstrin-like domain
MAAIEPDEERFLPEIRLGRIGILKVYQITEEELTRLITGSSQSLLLNFGIAVLSTAMSFLTALLTTEISSNRIFIVFVVITVLGFLVGVILLLLWLPTRHKLDALVTEIRDRLPPEGNPRELP